MYILTYYTTCIETTNGIGCRDNCMWSEKKEIAAKT